MLALMIINLLAVNGHVTGLIAVLTPGAADSCCDTETVAADACCENTRDVASSESSEHLYAPAQHDSCCPDGCGQCNRPCCNGVSLVLARTDTVPFPAPARATLARIAGPSVDSEPADVFRPPRV